MNGVHDMGGMHGMGPVRHEKYEPVFHAPWEARTFALMLAAGAWRKWNIDASRYTRELIPAADYLRMSYYERWFASLVELLVTRGLVTRAEIESGRAAPGSPRATPPLTADKVPSILRSGALASRSGPAAPRFQVGQRVRARNTHPAGHTRLPRYARGKLGTIGRDHGVYVFPDTNAQFLGEKPQHVYSVRFAARELWGEQASPGDAVYVDMWDDYLEPA
ncbi:MAG: nitrile hydratase subunit beta [Bacillati bacterium ANGP1]|uniref:Nitrile hydratase subunit beta n=1 Tax=Candidatus Segetimicrobium genomatis TaxID=2569760 RepID=A0A537M0R9_9BACT|nr:MAG: nitrile hydratase subunit beta [Terrabacteria group bacterium ANGP1]